MKLCFTSKKVISIYASQKVEVIPFFFNQKYCLPCSKLKLTQCLRCPCATTFHFLSARFLQNIQSALKINLSHSLDGCLNRRAELSPASDQLTASRGVLRIVLTVSVISTAWFNFVWNLCTDFCHRMF